MGVLQRFGISYFVVASLHILLAKPFQMLPQNQIKRAFYDIILLGPQWIVMCAIVILQLGLAFGLYIPGCPR